MEIVVPFSSCFLIRFLQFPFEMSCPDFAMPNLIWKNYVLSCISKKEKPEKGDKQAGGEERVYWKSFA